jgi:hypothetical protein
MIIRTLPSVQKECQATALTEVFFPMTPWYPSLECANALATVLAVTSKSGNFQCRLGIQSAVADVDNAGAAVVPASTQTQVTTVTKTYLRFDPNGATEGNIDAGAFFRVGVFVSLSAGTVPASGTVVLQALSWR